MMVELQLWQMISLLLGFFGAVWGFWRYIKGKEEKEFGAHMKRLDDRFNLIDKDMSPLKQSTATLDTRVGAIEKNLERINTSPVLLEMPAEVREMRACQKGMQHSMDVMRTSLSRIEDYLLNGNRR
ncbi:MAG: hypothetical protein LBE22_07735 [Azoarcus sp.]|jgi:septation ring formation regulator EzrA|nr:hypothetical protein [Azoarcus sp.]